MVKVVLSIFILFACIPSSYADQVLGFKTIEIGADSSKRSLSLSIWYPATAGKPIPVAGNAVFEGISASRDATIATGKFPIVFVSHGGLRSTDNSGAWLTSALARSGRIAVEVNALRPRTAQEGVNDIWNRPHDISRALDAILDDASFFSRVDMLRTSVVGYALGGTAALALSGGEFDEQNFIRSCSGADMNTPDCAWYKAQNVTLDSVDKDQLVASWYDSRIKATVAINPEYLSSFLGSGASIKVPSLLITLGNDQKSRSANQMKSVKRIILKDTNVFDGFGLCTSAGPTIISDEGGDPDLCGSSAETRMHSHKQIVETIESFLQVRD